MAAENAELMKVKLSELLCLSSKDLKKKMMQDLAGYLLNSSLILAGQVFQEVIHSEV